MNYRLDKYGNKLSILGFGCMRFQRKAGGIDMQEAEKEMSRILLDELYDSEVLERRTSFEVTDNSFKLSCEVFCLTDIALEKEIKTN